MLEVVVGVGVVTLGLVALYLGTRRRRTRASGRDDVGPGVPPAAAPAAVPQASTGELPDTEAGRLIEAVGGRSNIVGLDACITRLSIEVADLSKVDKPALQKLGAAGVLEVGSTVRAIVGPRAEALKSQMQTLI
jgi:glucose-like phosphotransferase system IIB component